MAKVLKKNGFTLIELAIVLIIIGLIVGGVLQGQELIEQANIRSTISTIKDAEAALNTFKSKYGPTLLPGDMSHANAYGLDRDSDGNLNVALFGPDAENDGNENGLLQGTLGAGTYIWFEGEVANFWIHLSNMGVIKSLSQVSGCNSAGTRCLATPGITVPRTAVGNGIVAVTSSTLRSLYFVAGIFPNSNELFGVEATNGIMGDSISPPQAYGIDTKLDDGRPDAGIIRVISLYSATGTIFFDAAGAADCFAAAGNYNLSVKTKTCTLSLQILK